MAVTTEQSDSTADFAAWLTGHRRAILDAIRFYGDESHTSNIREYSGVPRGSFNHHIEALLNPPEKFRDEVGWLNGEGLIEVTGEVDVGKPSPARQFAVTDAGEKAFETVIDDVGIRASDVRDLQQRVEELEAQRSAGEGAEQERIEELESYVEELESEIERMQDAYNDMVDVVRELDGGQTPE